MNGNPELRGYMGVDGGGRGLAVQTCQLVTDRVAGIDTPEDEIDWVIDVNLKGVWRGTFVFGKRMREQTTSSIICNIGSENYWAISVGGWAFTRPASMAFWACAMFCAMNCRHI